MSDEAEREISETQIVEDAIKLAVETKERIATNPDALRKILTNRLDVEDWVTVYPDKGLNLKFAKHNEALNDLQAESRIKPGEEYDAFEARVLALKPRLDALDAEGEQLRADLEESAATIHFRGLGKKAVKGIRNQARAEYPLPPAGTPDDPAVSELRDEWYQNHVIAAHIQHGGFTVEDVADWRDAFSDFEFGKLWAMALKLSITDDYLRGALDVDF